MGPGDLTAEEGIREELEIYLQSSYISHTLVSNRIVGFSDVVEASPVGTARTTSSPATSHLASIDWAKVTAWWEEKHVSLSTWCASY